MKMAIRALRPIRITASKINKQMQHVIGSQSPPTQSPAQPPPPPPPMHPPSTHSVVGGRQVQQSSQSQ